MADEITIEQLEAQLNVAKDMPMAVGHDAARLILQLGKRYVLLQLLAQSEQLRLQSADHSYRHTLDCNCHVCRAVFTLQDQVRNELRDVR